MHLHFGKKENIAGYVMVSDSEEVWIIKVKYEKDLGEIIDSKLLFREHISNKVATTNKILSLIFRTFTDLDKDKYLTFVQNTCETASGICYTSLDSAV